MDNFINKLEQICKCGVCLERFNVPKQLSCQHIFCERCLMKACIVNKMGLMSLFCPACRERQPMVYNSYDVVKLKPSFFVNQILEVLVEFSELGSSFDNQQWKPSHGTPQKLLNTKITRVYKSVNKDTQEHLMQIRTDEFSLRDSKVHQLEEEIKRSKEINSQLVIDNFIMKTKLDGVLDAKMSSSRTNIEKKLRSLNSPDSAVISVGKSSMCETDECIIKPNPNGLSTFESDKFKTFSIENKLKNYLSRKNAMRNITTQNDKYDRKFKTIDIVDNRVKIEETNPTTANNTTSASTDQFCWRCLRHGHCGSKCKESKTVLGRYICQKCNKVGHTSEKCVERDIITNKN